MSHLGLDPQTRNQLWTHVRRLNEEERVTVFLTTHYMEEADRVAHRIAIIDHGRIVAQGTSAESSFRPVSESLEQAFLALTGSSDPGRGRGCRRRPCATWRKCSGGDDDYNLYSVAPAIKALYPFEAAHFASLGQPLLFLWPRLWLRAGVCKKPDRAITFSSSRPA